MKKLALHLITLMSPLIALAGGSSDGGGNAIRCDTDGKVYAWDYINAKLDVNQIDPVFLAATNVDQILDEMIRRLTLKNNRMAGSLYDFRQFNRDPFADRKRLWLFGPNPLINLGDEDRTRLPRTCIANAQPDFKLFQAVIRSREGDEGRTIYQADENVLQQLAENGPLQLSFLYIHEWLRDYSSNPTDIVIVNQLLHSSKLYEQGTYPFLDTLKAYRMKVKSSGLDILPYDGVLEFVEGSRIFENVRFEIMPDTNVHIVGRLLPTIPTGQWMTKTDPKTGKDSYYYQPDAPFTNVAYEDGSDRSELWNLPITVPAELIKRVTGTYKKRKERVDIYVSAVDAPCVEIEAKVRLFSDDPSNFYQYTVSGKPGKYCVRQQQSEKVTGVQR